MKKSKKIKIKVFFSYDLRYFQINHLSLLLFVFMFSSSSSQMGNNVKMMLQNKIVPYLDIVQILCIRSSEDWKWVLLWKYGIAFLSTTWTTAGKNDEHVGKLFLYSFIVFFCILMFVNHAHLSHWESTSWIPTVVNSGRL